MQCPQCQHENRQEARFCDACGNALSWGCSGCKRVARPDAIFCDRCGTRLAGGHAVATSLQVTPPDGESGSRLHAVLPWVIAFLQREGRVTYRTLTSSLAIDAALLDIIRDELAFKRLAHDEDGKGLVWTGETPPALPLHYPPLPDTTTQVTAQVTPPVASRPPEPSAVPELDHATLEAERRHLTVMFCDLADSTMLAQQLDPEDLREVIRAYQTVATEVMAPYEGYMAQYLGDGLLVYFGWPQAHEDDAPRALHSALGIIEAILTTLNPRLEADKGVRIAIRIGIHTGPVVVGEMGSGNRHEHLATGETVNIAARLEGLAAPNTVLISATVARLVDRTFDLEALGPQVLKGIAEPMAVFRVLDTTEGAADERRFFTHVPLLVGRDEEVKILERCWEQSKAGRGQAVMISGEAGIGKSSLLEVMRAQVREARLSWIAFRCSPYHHNTALYPIITHLERLLRFARHDSPGVKVSKLETGLQTQSLPLQEVVPLFAALLSVPLPEGRYAALNITPQQQKQQTLDALVAWLLEEAERRPLLVAWEDLHWADPSTLEVLALVLEQSPMVSILNLSTFRPQFTPPWPRRSHLTQITLNRLEPPQIEALVHHLAGSKTLPGEVVQHIVAKTDGVPLYVEELTKMFLTSTLLQEEATAYALTGPLPRVAIPDTLQDSLMARLDRLPSAKAVAQFGAVLGREFSHEMLQAIWPQNSETLQAGLTQLIDTELLYQRGRPPRARYLFKHALIRDAAYASLLRSTRQQVHQQVAQVLEEQFPEVVETQPELLAYHATEAGCHDQALAYWRQAGQRALTRSAYGEAIGAFERALETLKYLPESSDTFAQAIDVRLALRTALVPGGDIGRIQNYLREAESLAESLDDPQRLGQISALLAIQYYIRGAYDEMIVQCQRAVMLASSQQDIGLQAVANTYLGMAHYLRGDYHQSIACLQWTIDTLNGELAQEYFGQGAPPAVHAYAHLAQSHAELGVFAAGIACGEAGIRVAEAASRPLVVMSAYRGIGLLYLRQGDLSRALPVLERAVSICQEMHMPLYFVLVAPTLGAVYTLAGRLDEAVSLLTQVVEQSVSMGVAMNQAQRVAFLGEAHLQAGRLEDASRCAQQALALSHTHVERGHWAYIQRLLGDLEMHRDPPATDQAATHYRQALALAEELGMRPLQAHCHRSLGLLHAHLGEADPARSALSTAVEMYREMVMTFWLPETEAALAAVEGKA